MAEMDMGWEQEMMASSCMKAAIEAGDASKFMDELAKGFDGEAFLADMVEAVAQSGPAPGYLESWSSEKCVRCLEALFKAGAMADARAMWMASRYGCVAAVECLMSHGGDPNEIFDRGFVWSGSIHAAAGAMMGSPSLIEAMVKAGANPNLLDSHGMTPIHAAAGRMNWPVFEALVQGGGDPWIMSKDGQDALEYARGSEGVIDSEEEAGRRQWAQALVDAREVSAAVQGAVQGQRKGLAL